jgi:2',3'-cyclic-nucleotide 2'-phosphodiesterase
MRILFIGDVCGGPGRAAISRWLPGIQDEYAVDFVVANGENAAGGLGATPATIGEMLKAGVHAVTLGNHAWRKKELVSALDSLSTVVRPANFPAGVPGRGAIVAELDDGRRVGVLNLVGRVFMEPYDCPFKTGLREVERLRAETPIVLVDMHAEATAEKVALGWHLDGRCSAVLGTHTHVQTADERVLPQGTAYITDVGMTGPQDGVIGVERERVIRKFLTGLPTQFAVSKERPGLNAVLVEVDDETGKAAAIQRVVRVEE